MNKKLENKNQSIDERINLMADTIEYLGWKANKESLKETMSDIAAYQAGTAPAWFDENMCDASIKEVIRLKEEIYKYEYNKLKKRVGRK